MTVQSAEPVFMTTRARAFLISPSATLKMVKSSRSFPGKPTPSFTMSLLNAFSFIFMIQFLSFLSLTDAAGSDEWRRRSIYQLMTDRFARTNDNDNSPCDVLKYCGGTYQGLIHHLDWIQDMGFTAVPESVAMLM